MAKGTRKKHQRRPLNCWIWIRLTKRNNKAFQLLSQVTTHGLAPQGKALTLHWVRFLSRVDTVIYMANQSGDLFWVVRKCTIYGWVQLVALQCGDSFVIKKRTLVSSLLDDLNSFGYTYNLIDKLVLPASCWFGSSFGRCQSRTFFKSKSPIPKIRKIFNTTIICNALSHDVSSMYVQVPHHVRGVFQITVVSKVFPQTTHSPFFFFFLSSITMNGPINLRLFSTLSISYYTKNGILIIHHCGISHY